MISSKKEIVEKLKITPDKPGVYVFKDSAGSILYVGKGRLLRKRIRSYFQKTRSHSPKTELLIEKISDFDFYITHSEVEALILESNLIKEHKPRFNINLRDDKSYPSIAVTLDDRYPRVMFTRKLGMKGTRYFGPYTNSRATRDTIDTLRRIFPVRHCRRKEPGRQQGAPCLNYHIERCLGPCTGQVDEDEYGHMIEQICLFLEGKQEKVIAQLEIEMKEAAKKLEYEKAARLRNRIGAAKQVLQKQKIISRSKEDRDIIGYFSDDKFGCVTVFFVRGGRLIGSKNYILDKSRHIDETDLLTSFLKQFYLRAAYIPGLILVSADIEDKSVTEEWLTRQRGKKVTIAVPKRGEKKKLVELAGENAQAGLELIKLKKEFQKERIQGGLFLLRGCLGMTVDPSRIEAYDISTIGGKGSVGSMVVFEDGRPKKKEYRKFKIRSIEGQDDCAMMAEIIKRRFSKYLEEKDIEDSSFSKKPDLVIIDGGKPQLSAALNVLKEFGIENISVIALAKKREEIYLPGQSKPLKLPHSSPAIKMIQAIRDEAHRFAVGYHRGLREKEITSSMLDKIPGIGVKRKKALVAHFGSPKEIFKASQEELAGVQGISNKIAKDIYNYIYGFK